MKRARDHGEKYLVNINIIARGMWCRIVLVQVNMPLKSKYYKVGNLIIMESFKKKFYNQQ